MALTFFEQHIESGLVVDQHRDVTQKQTIDRIDRNGTQGNVLLF